MARFTSVLLLAVAALPFAFATNCGSNEFFYSKKNCCLPHGGLPSPPSPPPSFQCPTNDWYYHPEQGCCVPSHPQTPTSPPPQCHPSCTWKPDDSKCIPNSPSPSPPQNTYTPPYPPKNTYTPPSPPKATPPPSKPSPPPTSPSCPSSHFWYEPAGCCPHGGPPTTPPSPPPDTSCPPDGWYWHAGAGCCAPHHPVPPSSPPPTCKPGCSWNPGSSTCHPQPPTPPSNPPPKPSHHYKRHMKSRAVTLCPLGLEACPIKGMLTSSDDYECLDTTSELQSCGGCASTGVGQDCTAIEGVWNVACNVGKCEIGSCASGYKLSIDGKSCLKL